MFYNTFLVLKARIQLSKLKTFIIKSVNEAFNRKKSVRYKPKNIRKRSKTAGLPCKSHIVRRPSHSIFFIRKPRRLRKHPNDPSSRNPLEFRVLAYVQQRVRKRANKQWNRVKQVYD